MMPFIFFKDVLNSNSLKLMLNISLSGLAVGQWPSIGTTEMLLHVPSSPHNIAGCSQNFELFYFSVFFYI